ncbi:MAG TPA: type II toxin-antitoxin system prevent-host-death family antitoxin [Thermoanaerobaculia bacterium]|jgi:prevent-host-death family protein
MSTAGVRDLKNHLTRYLRRTQAGESIVVTDRGRPVAILGPLPESSADESLEQRLARLAERGTLSLPSRRPARRPTRVRVRGAKLSRTVIAERE